MVSYQGEDGCCGGSNLRPYLFTRKSTLKKAYRYTHQRKEKCTEICSSRERGPASACREVSAGHGRRVCGGAQHQAIQRNTGFVDSVEVLFSPRVGLYHPGGQSRTGPASPGARRARMTPTATAARTCPRLHAAVEALRACEHDHACRLPALEARICIAHPSDACSALAPAMARSVRLPCPCLEPALHARARHCLAHTPHASTDPYSTAALASQF